MTLLVEDGTSTGLTSQTRNLVQIFWVRIKKRVKFCRGKVRRSRWLVCPYSIFHIQYSIIHIPYSIFLTQYSIIHIPYIIFQARRGDPDGGPAHIPHSVPEDNCGQYLDIKDNNFISARPEHWAIMILLSSGVQWPQRRWWYDWMVVIMQNVDNHKERLVEDDYNYDDICIYYDEVSVCLSVCHEKWSLPTSELSATGAKWAAC